MEEVRVRFAPSPTGFLHVGGARTAIFNWLYAKNRKGKFLLRIEDTDPRRSKSELTEQIIRSLNWLGIVPDEPVIYQSDRIERYREVVRQLIADNKAYYAFESAEELAVKRLDAQQKKISSNYDRTSLQYDAETVKRFIDDGKPYSIRFLVPEGVTEFDDLVHGSTAFQNSGIDDFVILRSDGTPTYQIAVVVDDHDMNITHVIRGDDHLTNTPKQILLYKALGWEIPEFAHLPMIFDEEKKKLSKRRNTVSVEEYRRLGYLAEALFNFLTLLGFAPPDNREIISREELIQLFSFDRVNKKSAVFDIKKLNWINEQYIKSTDEKEIARLIKEKLSFFIDEPLPAVEDKYIISIVPLMKERVTTVNEFIEKGKYFFIEPESYDEKGLAKYWNSEIKQLMLEYLELLKMSDSPLSGGNTRGGIFKSADLEEQLRRFAEQKNIKPAVIIHPLRLALTGTTASPGIFELMEVLGRIKTINRIDNLLQDWVKCQ